MRYESPHRKPRAYRVIPALLAVLVAVTSVPALAGQLVITSLPYTVNQSSHSASIWDTITIQGTRLTSRNNGIIFSASTHHWLVLLANDTIAFGTDSTYRPAT